MKKLTGSVFLEVALLTVLVSGCALASTPQPTITPSSILPTSAPFPTQPTFTSMPALPTFTEEPVSTKTTVTNPITSVKVFLPEQYNWEQITNNFGDNQYIREWVPPGSTGSDTKWIIVEQKFVVESPVSAKEFLIIIFTLAKDACTDILYNGPEKIDVEGHETYVGRFMCAEQKGMSYGTFTDQRVAVQGNDVYIVTSELRVPSSPKAGILSFQENQQDELQTFMAMQELSANFVRDFVTICTSETVDC